MTTPKPPVPDETLRGRIAAALLARIKLATISGPQPFGMDATTRMLAATEYDLADVVLAIVAGERGDGHAACYVCARCGFHWHGRTATEAVPMRDGQPVCPRCANTGHSEAIPAWEAAYDSATYTPHLIGYCTDEVSAQAAALAWFRANCETTDALAWESEPRLAVGEWDQWFILRQTDPDGTALATDIVVRRRAAAVHPDAQDGMRA
jgi:hypothetical protein